MLNESWDLEQLKQDQQQQELLSRIHHIEKLYENELKASY